jgi:NADH-quinone oxidoreductase subunit G
LGNLLDVEGFDYTDTTQILDELSASCSKELAPNGFSLSGSADRQLTSTGLQRVGDTPLNAVDTLVRRATALQQTADAGRAVIRLNPADAERLGITDEGDASVKQNGYQASLPVAIDESLPEGCVGISTGLAETAGLGQPFGDVSVEKA